LDENGARFSFFSNLTNKIEIHLHNKYTHTRNKFKTYKKDKNVQIMKKITPFAVRKEKIK
jgi:hypothetical protein